LAVGFVKDTLAKVLIPIVEALGGGSKSHDLVMIRAHVLAISSRYLEHFVELETSLSKKKLGPAFTSPSLSSLAQSSWASLPRISSLLGRSDISFGDDLIIQTVYLAITPLFVSEPGTTKKRGKEVVGVGAGMMKSLRVEALGCLRGVSLAIPH
jgi:cohesin loading factor subunit SCC2